ncbi:MAG TPA: site-2 protease family protein [Anaerolineae bacterium]|jgi:membrane-associated protease RseP (regulator of RpoE activity)|nr:site-2 protease family protein [Anaerolineae bacterium]
MEQADDLRRDVDDLFLTTSITIDRPETGHIRLRGRFLCELAACYGELRRRFERHGFTPFIRRENGTVSLIAAPVVFNPPGSRWIINLALLVATILSTLWIGALSEFAATEQGTVPGLGDLWLGLPYCLSLMTILGAHELGHYFAARHHRVPVTLPYFIPLPLPPIGTLGAFIRLKAPVTSKRALLDVGAAGPLAGLVFAIPILIYGLSISPVEPLPDGSYYLEGNSIFYALAKLAVKGQVLPNGGQDVLLSQVAWAGWVGLLVTGLNLIPVGQLDGGHIAYALFGERARLLYWPVIVTLVVLVVLTRTPMWALWAVLLFFLGRYYAEPLDDVTPLDGRRQLLAIFSLFVFFLVFVPIPLRIISA